MGLGYDGNISSKIEFSKNPTPLSKRVQGVIGLSGNVR